MPGSSSPGTHLVQFQSLPTLLHGVITKRFMDDRRLEAGQGQGIPAVQVVSESYKVIRRFSHCKRSWQGKEIHITELHLKPPQKYDKEKPVIKTACIRGPPVLSDRYWTILNSNSAIVKHLSKINHLSLETIFQ